MAKRNFLLGKGERLTQSIVIKGGGGEKAAPYTFIEAVSRLTPMLTTAVRGIESIPDEACPEGQAIATVTLNPEYIAKSYFPAELFRETGLTAVGSKPRRITPAQRSKGRTPEETLTTELFVAGSKQAFRAWREAMPRWQAGSALAKEVVTIEEVAAPAARGKIKGTLPRKGVTTFEVVLHAEALASEETILPAFKTYLRGIGVESKLDRRFYAGGLCFVEVEAPAGLAEKIATFSVVRALREMPRLRVLQPAFRTSGIPSPAVKLPGGGVVDKNIRAAIFDGGLPAKSVLASWAHGIDAPGVGSGLPEFESHGCAVTSAYLFGHIDPTQPLLPPYSTVDHYRVLDDAPGQNPHELYEVLDRIERVLDDNDYDFINLSIGPSLPIEDDDIHAWTAVLDDRLARADTLAAVAVGNNGESDDDLGLNRVQVPSDCVNAVAIGATDRPDSPWSRAPYSSVGPGRSPGLVKPDLVEFGGSLQRPFVVIGPGREAQLDATGGTSFAAPSALRLAAGVRAHFGNSLSLLAVRTLLTHTAEESEHPHRDVGRGRVARSLEDVVIVDDDTVRVIYQGKISPGKYIRAPIPMPDGMIKGAVEITATLCYKCLTDPHHPGNYTRAGLEPTFRPHDGKFSREEQVHPDARSFFTAVDPGTDEDILRRDAWKWENCLHKRRRFRGSSLRNPCFDIHYNARLAGRNFVPAEKLSYALAVTVHAKSIVDLYDQIVRKYATRLEALRPTVEIPVRT